MAYVFNTTTRSRESAYKAKRANELSLFPPTRNAVERALGQRKYSKPHRLVGCAQRKSPRFALFDAMVDYV